MYSEDFKDSHISEKEYSHNEILWKNIMDNSVILTNDNHYEIDLPIKEGINLPNNRRQVYGIFESLLRRLDKNETLKEDYTDFMNMMLENKFIEKIPEKELNKPAWYISHHSVYHKQKKKVRIVYNCSLKYGGMSLNDALYQGPDLVNNLLGVILRFRQEPVAFVGNIV